MKMVSAPMIPKADAAVSPRASPVSNRGCMLEPLFSARPEVDEPLAVGMELLIAPPAGGFIQGLRRQIAPGRAQLQSDAALIRRITLRCRQESPGSTHLACLRRHEQIVESEDSRHEHRAERRIELAEADCPPIG